MYALLVLSLSLPPSLEESPAPRLVGEPAELKVVSGTLHATIELPAGRGPWPAVLLHPGSGPTDRDGNQPFLRNNSLKMLGRALAAEGIAVLRVDKRGVGASRAALAKEADIRFDAYAADAAAWVAFLRADGRFTKVGIVGHSEGALIGLVAAKDAKPDALVSLCGAGRPLADVLREQLKKNLPKDQYEASEKIMAELEAGRTVDDVPKALLTLFRPSVQPYLISVFRYDPVKLAAAFPGPLVVVGGTTDLQVPPDDARRLAAARPGTTVVVIDDMNHLLKRVASTERLTQLPSYTDPAVPLHPKLVGAVAGFLRAALGK
jgi:pimeloyl-ACP methyl ester carboxylesterase